MTSTTERTDHGREVDRYVGRCVAYFGDALVSIIRYPHPFTEGGLVVVLEDEAGPLLTLTANAQACGPPDLAMICLKRSELFELSLPTRFAVGFYINEYVHLAWMIKHKGQVLHGIDIRDEISPPVIDPSVQFEAHLAASVCYLRNHCILRHLIDESYSELLAALNELIRHLMATALLVHDVWDVQMDTIPEDFYDCYPDPQLTETCREAFDAFTPDTGPAGATKQEAFEAVWQVECLLHQLKRAALP